ncbi:hypothetical protein D3C73_225570 [compost metagenome]
MHVILGVFDADLQFADMIKVIFGKRTVEQVQAQYTVTISGHVEGLFASLDLHRTFAPRQARILRTLVALDFIDAGQVLLRTTVGLRVHEWVEPGKTIAQPVPGDAVRQVAEGEHIDHVGADAAHHGYRAQRNLIDLPPRLVRRVAIVATRHFELGDFEGLLLVDLYASLRQLKLLRLTDIDLQAVVEQLSLDPLFVLAAL